MAILTQSDIDTQDTIVLSRDGSPWMADSLLNLDCTNARRKVCAYEPGVVLKRADDSALSDHIALFRVTGAGHAEFSGFEIDDNARGNGGDVGWDHQHNAAISCFNGVNRLTVQDMVFRDPCADCVWFPSGGTSNVRSAFINNIREYDRTRPRDLGTVSGGLELLHAHDLDGEEFRIELNAQYDFYVHLSHSRFDRMVVWGRADLRFYMSSVDVMENTYINHCLARISDCHLVPGSGLDFRWLQDGSTFYRCDIDGDVNIEWRPQYAPQGVEFKDCAISGNIVESGSKE